MTKIHLGCGLDYKSDYINLDVNKSCKADVYHDLNHYPYPFKDNTADEIIACHIIEHLDDPVKFLKECHRVLKLNSRLIVECPIGGTWSSYHFNHKFNLTPYSFLIFNQKRWNWQFKDMSFKVGKIVVQPFFNKKINLPWRFIYLNCFVNNILTAMKAELIKA